MGQIFDREHESPEPSSGDRIHTLVKTAIDSVPIVGSAASALFAHLIMAPLERRSAEWMEDVAGALRRLESEKRIDIDTLRENPAFIDTVVTASQNAVKTSQKTKLAALRNAVANAALPTAPDVTKQQIFLSLVDRFTDWHLRILALFSDPTGELRARPKKSISPSLP